MKTDYSLPLKEGISSQGDHILKSGQEQFVGSTFTWSSVGPAVDGDNGVDITAPGGAVSFGVPTRPVMTIFTRSLIPFNHVLGDVRLLVVSTKVDADEWNEHEFTCVCGQHYLAFVGMQGRGHSHLPASYQASNSEHGQVSTKPFGASTRLGDGASGRCFGAPQKVQRCGV